MKKLLGIIVLGLLLCSNSYAALKKGKGEVSMSDRTVNYFIKYIRGGISQHPLGFIMSSNGTWASFFFCPEFTCRDGNYMPTIRECEAATDTDCGLFARKRTIIWDNGIKPKKALIKSKWSDQEIKNKLKEWGFIGASISSTTTTTPKITKKKKVVKKYETKGKRSIALSWEGYEELIAGTVNFDETDYKGTLNLPLPNNDGTCDGTYSLQEDGKGTWQIACSNNMGAAGTLKWVKDGGVTGTGRDHNDKKVKFTVSKNS